MLPAQTPMCDFKTNNMGDPDMVEVRERMSERIHTFPVPTGWSPEQAWEHHSRGEKLPTDQGCYWVNLTTRYGRLHRWEDA